MSALSKERIARVREYNEYITTPRLSGGQFAPDSIETSVTTLALLDRLAKLEAFVVEARHASERDPAQRCLDDLTDALLALDEVANG
jgi:hypothetical protein